MNNPPAVPPATGKRPRVDPSQLSDKKLRRLQKNRESARECRRKKKEQIANIERQINRLEGENLHLRLQLKIGKEAEEADTAAEIASTSELSELLRTGASEGEIWTNIEDYKEKFADYGRDRREAINFHLRNVERLLQPTTTTMVGMRAIENSGPNEDFMSDNSDMSDGDGGRLDDFAEEEDTKSNSNGLKSSDLIGNEILTRSASSSAASTTSASAAAAVAGVNFTTTTTTDSTFPPPSSANIPIPIPHPFPGSSAASVTSSQAADLHKQAKTKSLFSLLAAYMGVTPEQNIQLRDSRHVARELDLTYTHCTRLCTELRSRITSDGLLLDEHFKQVSTILTPTQLAKFVIWVSNNPACMHMLNELWAKVYVGDKTGTETEGGKKSRGTGNEGEDEDDDDDEDFDSSSNPPKGKAGEKAKVEEK